LNDLELLKLNENFHEQYIREKIFNKEEYSTNNKTCPVCGKKNVIIGVPSTFSSYAEGKKPFNFHLTRGERLNFKCCNECALKLNRFEWFLKNRGIDIFPLFISEDYKKTLINYLKSSKDKGMKFFNIVKNVVERDGPRPFDFYLVIRKKDFLYFDYVNNYRFDLGNWIKWDKQSQQINMRDLLGKFNDIFNNISEKNISKKDISSLFFEKNLKNKNLKPMEKYLIFTYLEKIFNLIYRNSNVLSKNDVEDIICNILDNKILNAATEMQNQTKDSAKNLLEFYLNSNLFTRGDVMNSDELDSIRNKKPDIVSKKTKLSIESDEEFAYFLGQLVYFLVQQSKTNQNKTILLQPLVNCHNIQSLKKILFEKYLEKYYHGIQNEKDFKHDLISKILSHLEKIKVTSFDRIKLPFYVGYFDDNIFIQKNGRDHK